MPQTLGSPAYTSSSSSGIDRALKELYAPAMNELPNKKRVLLSRLQRDGTKRSLVGRRFLEPINIRGSQGLGARAATGSTPTSGAQTIIEALIPPVYLYGSVVFNLPAIKASRNDAGAFARVMDIEMNGMRRDAQNDENRQLHGNGLGSLATVNGTPAAAETTIVTDSAAKLAVGMVLDSYTNSGGDPSSTQEMDSKTISTISGTTLVMTAAVGATITDGSHLIREENRGNEITGVAAALATSGTYMGIPKTTYSEWRGSAVAAGSTTISDSLLMQGILLAEQQGEGDVDLLVGDYFQFRTYAGVLTALRRYTTAQELLGGFRGIEVGNAVFLPDRDTTSGQVLCFDTSTWVNLDMTEGWEWDDTDGNVLHKQEGGVTYEGILAKYTELYCRDPLANCIISGLTTS